jgi:hypothetical protein
MKTHFVRLASATFLLGIVSLPVLAQDPHDPHPTLTAAHRFGHRKVAHVSHVTHHAQQHVRNWKHRKEHNTRAWLNKH